MITNDRTDTMREVRRMAIFQDAINGVGDNTDAPPTRWWAAHGDTLWTAGVAGVAGVDASGVAFRSGDIVVHSHRLDTDSARATGGFAVYDLAGRTPMQAVLDEITKWENVTPQLSGTVDVPGRARLADPVTGRPLVMGWSEALANAASHPADTDDDIVRASLLEAGLEMGEQARTGPAVYLLEDNGIDLTVIEWSVDDQGRYTGYSFHHEQYDEDAASPQLVSIGHSDRPEHIPPQHWNDRQLLDASRRIFDQYQVWRNGQGGPMAADMPHHIARSDIARPGDKPLLQLGDGRTAPTWDELIDRTAVMLAAGRQPDIAPTPSPIPASDTTGQETQRQPDAAHRQLLDAWVANADARPYVLHARDGRDWDKMIVRLPANTTIDGRRLDGWALDCFMSAANKRQKSEGRDVQVRFRPGHRIELFQGRGRQRRSITIDDPAKLCEAIGTARTTPQTPPPTTAPQTPDPPQTPGLPDDMHQDAERLLDPANRPKAQPALDLVGFTAEHLWDRVDRLQTQLSGYAQDGRFDPALALKASRRIIDKAAVAFEHEHGNPHTRLVADTRFSLADRADAALLLLDNLLNHEQPTKENTMAHDTPKPTLPTDDTEAQIPQPGRSQPAGSHAQPDASNGTAGEEPATPTAAEETQDVERGSDTTVTTDSRQTPGRPKGDRKSFFANLRDRVGAALAAGGGRQTRPAPDHDRRHGRGI